MSTILSLDLATVTGWAVISCGATGVTTSGSQDFSRYPGSKSRPAHHAGESFAMFHRWLSAMLATEPPAQIVHEEVAGFFKSAHAARVIFGFRGILYAQAAARGIPVTGYNAQKVKLFWAGSGRAKKPDMIAATRRRCPQVDLTDGNEADALAVLHLHLSTT